MTASTKTQRTAVQRICSHVMPSSRTRGVTESGLKREYVHAPLHSVCGMAVPQLVRVNVEASGSSPLPANISNRLSSEVSLSSGTRKYIAVSFAAAKRLKKLERVTGHSNSPCFGSFAEEVNLTAIGYISTSNESMSP